ncbi:bifunctional nuclease family protein [Cruoricaptor ignavus]|uniref:Bifunctional nuclease family protein n=1 Tax=Cruoricaptor ignavus TaxID=1118202 RepID=A0A7M1T2C9_9FLAO|nr:bifunctional nuclease family protein [Cruoricaptor ignavus]QOR74000.1 bifunctional nuclease family protein [Cruoricaptor ignavus]
MDYKRLRIRGISYSQTQSGAYALLLEDEESRMKLPVVIGNYEAQSISLGLEKDIHPPRPLTHDLFTSFVSAVNFTLESVVIYQIVDGVFYSNINFRDNESGEELILDARTSDAVAMAVRSGAPIYTTKEVLNETGIILDIEEIPAEQDKAEDGDYQGVTKEALQDLLDKAVQEEDFDTALEIQEELKKRDKKID